MENYIEQFFSFAVELLQKVARESGPAIYQAAETIADVIENDKDVLLYGSGHSALIARDAALRAGGLVPVMAIQDIAEGDAERLEGLAQAIIARYELRPGSVIIIISNSGINAVPIEMAMLSKEAGLKVIAITSLVHSKSVASRHSSGKKLYDEADIVIDTHGIRGDAAIELPGSELKSGATSTLVGATILQSITVQAAAMLAERGVKPPVFISSNMPGGDEHNREMVERYYSRLVRYQIPIAGLSEKRSEK